MAQLIIDIPDPVVTRVLMAVSTRWGYQDTIIVDGNPVPNPETRAAFCKRMLAMHIRNWVREYEGVNAGNSARAAAEAAVEAEVIIT